MTEREKSVAAFERSVQAGGNYPMKQSDIRRIGDEVGSHAIGVCYLKLFPPLSFSLCAPPTFLAVFNPAFSYSWIC
jgi:hypothetical protein